MVHSRKNQVHNNIKNHKRKKTRHNEKNNDRMIIERQMKGIELSMMKKKDVSTK